MQNNVVVKAEGIEGTLKYVTGYTQFSGDVDQQEGNYLALKFDAESGTTITAQLIGAVENPDPVTIDSDMNLVVRVSNKSQAIKVVATNGDSVTEIVYPLSRITLEPKTE